MAEKPFKVCAACGQEKPAAEFHKNARMLDGLRSSCKPCVLATNRQSVLRHHEKRKAEKRAVYREQRDTPEYRAYVKAYQEATKERKREYDREYLRKNRERATRRAAEWNKRNPEKRSAIGISYSARRRSLEAGGISTADLAKWKAAQPKCCYWCGDKRAKEYTVDHYVPLTKGGKHEVGNIVLACRPCNVRKNAKDPLIFAREVGRLL